MEQFSIDIELDPVKDGINFANEDICEAHAVVLGTNGKLRQISMKEAEHILDGMSKCGKAMQLGNTDYAAIFNRDKVFEADGQEYLVGSVLVFICDGESLKPVPDDEIDDLIETAAGQTDTLRSGDMSFSALRVY